MGLFCYVSKNNYERRDTSVLYNGVIRNWRVVFQPANHRTWVATCFAGEGYRCKACIKVRGSGFGVHWEYRLPQYWKKKIQIKICFNNNNNNKTSIYLHIYYRMRLGLISRLFELIRPSHFQISNLCCYMQRGNFFYVDSDKKDISLRLATWTL